MKLNNFDFRKVFRIKPPTLTDIYLFRFSLWQLIIHMRKVHARIAWTEVEPSIYRRRSTFRSKLGEWVINSVEPINLADSHIKCGADCCPHPPHSQLVRGWFMIGVSIKTNVYRGRTYLQSACDMPESPADALNEVRSEAIFIQKEKKTYFPASNWCLRRTNRVLPSHCSAVINCVFGARQTCLVRCAIISMEACRQTHIPRLCTLYGVRMYFAWHFEPHLTCHIIITSHLHSLSHVRIHNENKK